jgi:hypothetical protein
VKYLHESFGPSVCKGDTIYAEHDGFMLTAVVHDDDTLGPPWIEYDWNGIVREIRLDETGRISKRLSECVLQADGWDATLYDSEEAMRVAKRAWVHTSGPHRLIGMMLGEAAHQLVERDFKHLKDWCEGEWSWVGISVAVTQFGLELVHPYECVRWALESNAGDYLVEVADELAETAIALARQKMRGLRVDLDRV